MIDTSPGRARVALWLLVLTAGGLVARGGTPPAGFTESTLVNSSEIVSPTAAAYEPGTGNLWIVEKGPGSALGQSRVRVKDALTANVTTALDLGCLDSRGERGILGIWFFFHPASKFVDVKAERLACPITGDLVICSHLVQGEFV